MPNVPPRLAYSCIMILGLGGWGCAPDRAPTEPGQPELLRAARSAVYVIEDLGTLGGAGSGALAINDAGVIVGWSLVSGNDPAQHAAVWDHGVVTDLGTLVGRNTQATAISRKGAVVGWTTLESGFTHAVRWTDHGIEDLGTLGGPASQAFGVNDFGVIVGWSTTSSGDRHAFVWRDGVMTDIGTLGGTTSTAFAINRHGVVVGEATTASGEGHAFKWSNGAFEDLGTHGAVFSTAYAINSKGDIAGTLGPTPDAVGGDREFFTSFRLSHGVLTLIDHFHHPTSYALGISAKGVVIGIEQDSRSETATADSWVWENGTTALLPEFTDGNSSPQGINRDGDIVGSSQLPDESGHAVVWRRHEGKPIG